MTNPRYVTPNSSPSNFSSPPIYHSQGQNENQKGCFKPCFISFIILSLMVLCGGGLCAGYLIFFPPSPNSLVFITPQPQSTPSPVKYQYTHQYEIVNEGPDDISELYFYEAVPPDLPSYQKLISWEADPDNYSLKTTESGWKTASFNLKTLKGGQSVKVSITSQVLVYPVHFSLGECQGQMIKDFVIPEEFIESDSAPIRNLAKELIKDTDNPCQQAHAFYDYVASTMTYQTTVDEKGAIKGLQSLTGDCTDFSDLFIALNRSVGIPARRVKGYTYDFNSKDHTDNNSPLNITHQWAEVYLPGSGWVPMDPTWGKGKKPNNIYFSGLTPTHITLTHSEKSGEAGQMHYGYNYKYFSPKPGPKVKVNDDLRMVIIP